MQPKEINNKDVILITHGDVDGMVCAAQILRREKSNMELVFSNAKFIHSKLYSVLQNNIPKRIYITDIPASIEVEQSLNILFSKGSEVFWIDHHPWPEGVYDRIVKLCTEVVYKKGLEYPAGALVGQWLKKEDPYYEQVGNICYAYEKGTDWERNWFRLLASYIGKSEREVLERLAYNQDFTQTDLDRIEQQKESEQISEDILFKQPETVTVKSGKEMAIYDTSQMKGVYLGQKVFQHHNVDFCLTRISEKKWWLASNPTSKHSMKALLGKHQLDNMTITIAGRENELLSIENVKNIDSIEPHKLIISWLCDRL